MLRKLPDRNETPPGNAWKNDKLQRKGYADKLTTLIRSLTQPFVISVNSPWGTGKTEFIRMWRQDLLDQNQPCVYFNAWETDFAGDPLLAFVDAIEEYINEVFPPSVEDGPVRSKFNIAKEFGKRLVRKAPRHLGKAAIKYLATKGLDLIDLKNDVQGPDADADTHNGASEIFSTGLAELGGDIIEEFQSQKKSIKDFKTSLEALAQSLADDGRTMPLVVFVDELDRCRPNYALELLENIKHLFDVPDIVFILAIDKKQLVNTVQTLYGAEMDHDGYLRRFIDYEFTLGEPDKIKFSEFLFHKFDIPSFFAKKNIGIGHQGFFGSFGEFSTILGLSLREQAQCFTQINVVLRMLEVDAYDFHYMLSFLIILKAKNLELYQKILSLKTNVNEIKDFFVKCGADSNFINSNRFHRIEFHLNLYLMNDTQLENLLKKCEEDIRTLAKGSPDFNRSEYFILHHKNLISNHFYMNENPLESFFNAIEMSQPPRF